MLETGTNQRAGSAVAHLPELAVETTFKLDHVLLQLVVGIEENGRKVKEVPLNLKLLYPYVITEEMCAQAEAQVRQAWEEQSR